jgi:4-hydroxy-3-methylbut-2-en-1-yl diphosphate synthase IspG/GcpE
MQGTLKCPLCGKEFDENDVGKDCPGACGMKCTSCSLITCPNCGYRMAGESSLLRWMEGIVNKLKGKNDRMG